MTLSTEDNVKLLKQLESGFKRTINWNKCHPKFKAFPQDRYLNYLIDPSFQGVNRLFLLPFKSETDRQVNTKYYLPTEKIKDHNVIIDGRNFFDQPTENDFKTYDNIGKIVTGQDLLDYNYFKKHYRLIAIDLSNNKNYTLIQKQ